MTTAEQPTRSQPHTRHLADAATFTGQAVRFLLRHRLGRLLTINPENGEPLVSPVHYVIDADGALVTHLPAQSEHVQALRRAAASGETSLLSVYSPHAHLPQQLQDEDGQPLPEAIRQVQARVHVEVIDDHTRVADVLRRQISSVLHRIGQQSEIDAAARASAAALAQLVVVRMEIEDIHTRLHRDKF